MTAARPSTVSPLFLTARRRSVGPCPQRPLDWSTLDDIASGLARAEPLWRSVARHDPHERQAVRLLATARYEVWVIGWAPEQGIELHDHGDSAGVFVVTEGTLTELELCGRQLVHSTVGPGDHRRLPLGMVHDVTNRGAAPATSIHVYSPPLSSMVHYNEATLAPMWTERVIADAPVVSAHTGASLLRARRRG